MLENAAEIETKRAPSSCCGPGREIESAPSPRAASDSTSPLSPPTRTAHRRLPGSYHAPICSRIGMHFYSCSSRICSELSVNGLGNPCSQPEEEKEDYVGKDLQKRKVLSYLTR